MTYFLPSKSLQKDWLILTFYVKYNNLKIADLSLRSWRQKNVSPTEAKLVKSPLQKPGGLLSWFRSGVAF
jgi:hypothetical protein